MSLQFSKAEGLGNDFVIVDCADLHRSDEVGARARSLCDRRHGIGGDGVICVLPAAVGGADYRMRIFNADCSEAEMCGNGVRCVGEYLRATGRFKEKFVLDTLAGRIEVSFTSEEDGGGRYCVNMGLPRFAPEDVPVIPVDALDKDFIMRGISVHGRTFRVTALSMGNPHAVAFVDELDDETVLCCGPEIQSSSQFPKGANVEFVRVISTEEVQMRVYERGCGETHACGTGACAAVVAGIVSHQLGNDVTVHLLGGGLHVSWDGKESSPVYMSGPARVVYSGTIG